MGWHFITYAEFKSPKPSGNSDFLDDNARKNISSFSYSEMKNICTLDVIDNFTSANRHWCVQIFKIYGDFLWILMFKKVICSHKILSRELELPLGNLQGSIESFYMNSTSITYDFIAVSTLIWHLIDYFISYIRHK